MKLYLILCFCYPIFLNDVLVDMICLISTDSMFIPNNVDIEEL